MLVPHVVAIALCVGANPLDDLAGSWDGNLAYRDYGTGEWVQIPMAVEADLHGDVLIDRTTYTDPGFLVKSTRLLRWDDEQSKLFTAEEGDGPFYLTERSADWAQDAQGWSMVVAYSGDDDDRPAEIELRYRFLAQSNQLTVEKHVDFSDDDEQTWLIRNRVSLTRQPRD